MPFVSPWWLAWLIGGAAAAVIPVLIHMIHTSRAPRVPFPTLRFLRTAAEKTARRRRIENLLLMLLRMLLFAVLAAALARPFLSKDFGLFAEAGESAAVLVLDTSASMGVRHEGETRFRHVKREARAVLESAWKPSQAAVLLTNPGPEPRPEALTRDRAALFRTIDRAPLSSGKADLAAAVRRAYALLDEARVAEKRLWILTDRQALSWEGVQDLVEPRRHPDIPVAVIRAEEPSLQNVALTEARVASRSLVVGMPIRFDVTVRNTGRAAEKRSVVLFADDLARARRKTLVDLAPAGAPGATKVVSLVHVFDRPGPHQVLVALDGTDALAGDDARRVPVTVSDRIPVLVAAPTEADLPYEDPAFYLMRALEPVAAGAGVPWAIRPERRLTADVNPGRLDRYEAVFLADLGGVTEELALGLESYVAGGGMLVAFVGPATDLDEANRLLATPAGVREAVLPARLKARVGDAVLKSATEAVTSVVGRSPFLEDLVDQAEIYQGVLVYEHVRTDTAAADAVLARLEGGDPFLLHKALGRGHVLLVTTTANTAWTNFPVRNLFMPLAARVVHLAVRERAPSSLAPGQPYEAELGPVATAPQTVTVTGPLGPAGETVTEETEPLARQGRALFRFEKTWHLGTYTWQAGDGPEAVRGVFATNPVGDEADLAEVEDEVLAGRIDAAETHVAGSLDALVERFAATAQRELWQYFLLVCLLIGVMEPLIANWIRPSSERARAHPTVAEPVAPAAPSAAAG